MSVNDDRLARLLGPDLLQPLRELVVELVEQALAGRERDRRWLSTQEAGEYLGGLSDSAVRKMAARGELRYSRLNPRLLIDRRDLDARLERARR